MSAKLATRVMTFGPYLLAAASIVATRALKQYSLAEGLAIAAFLGGLALWRLDRSTDRLMIIGACLGLGGLLLKGVFVWLGIGAEHHDMTTHETVPGNPVLVHIHHLFFNVGFLFYLAAAIRTAVTTIKAGAPR